MMVMITIMDHMRHHFQASVHHSPSCALVPSAILVFLTRFCTKIQKLGQYFSLNYYEPNPPELVFLEHGKYYRDGNKIFIRYVENWWKK